MYQRISRPEDVEPWTSKNVKFSLIFYVPSKFSSNPILNVFKLPFFLGGGNYMLPCFLRPVSKKWELRVALDVIGWRIVQVCNHVNTSSLLLPVKERRKCDSSRSSHHHWKLAGATNSLFLSVNTVNTFRSFPVVRN
jgi:hypothetical protein